MKTALKFSLIVGAMYCALAASSAANAAVPVANGVSPKLDRAVWGALETHFTGEGYVATDAAVTATEGAVQAAEWALVGEEVAATGTALVVGATAPAWLGIGALVLGTSAVFYGIQLGINWIFNSDGTVTISNGSTSVTLQPPPGTTYWSWSNNLMNTNSLTYLAATDPDTLFASVLAQLISIGWSADPASLGQKGVDLNPSGYVVDEYENVYDSQGNTIGAVLIFPQSGTPGFSCPTNQAWNGSTCLTNVTKGATGSSSNASSTSQAINSLSPQQKAAPLDPRNVANLANSEWQYASQQPGYQGVPYSSANPVTTQDVTNWQSANPGSYPSNGDALSPTVGQVSPVSSGGSTGSSGGSTTSGSAPPNSTTTTTTTNPNGTTTSTTSGTQNVDVVNPVSLNLGTDPGIQSPQLENTWSWTDILSPVSGLYPDLKSYQLPAHQSICPEPSFTAFGKTYTVTSFCDSLNSNSSILKAIFDAIYVVGSIFLVLA